MAVPARGTHGRHQVDLQAGGPAVLVVDHAVARGIVDQHIDTAEGIGGGLQPAGSGWPRSDRQETCATRRPVPLHRHAGHPGRPGRAQTETRAPAPANASAISRPMPLLPPAMSTRRPVKSITGLPPCSAEPCSAAFPAVFIAHPAEHGPALQKALQVELDALGQRQRIRIVDGVGLAAHVDLPRIRTGFAATAGVLRHRRRRRSPHRTCRC